MDIIKKIAFCTEEETSSETLSLCYRSVGATINTGDLCTTAIITDSFYILSSTKPVVTNGDIAYNTNNLSSLFDGGNKYYNVAYAEFVDNDTYIVQIDSSGVITVIDYCGT